MERGENKMRGKKVMVVVLCALLIFGALTFASVSLGQQKALADEATFYSTDSDGWLEGWSDAYNTVHDAVNAFNWNDGENELIIGQWYDVLSIYHIFRSAVFFDTSSLPDSAVITSATLSLFGDDNDGDSSDTDFNITVVDGSSLTPPPLPLAPSDYGVLGDKDTSGGAFNTSGFLENVYNDIQLNAAGMGWISKTGMTNFGLRSSRDIPPTTGPSGDEYVVVYSSEFVEGDDLSPRLVVTYEYPPASVPTLSQWGMIGMALVLAAFLVWSVRRRWVISADKS
jgi:hypothetical protein